VRAKGQLNRSAKEGFVFAADVPTYVIDLGEAESRRWAEVIAGERAVAARLVEEAGAEFARVPGLVRWVFARLYQVFGGLYRDEIASWAGALGVSVGTVTLLNCAYELSHLRWPKPFGCTTGVRCAEGLGMVQVRSLDWPLASMGGATRLFRYRRGGRAFVSVGVPGQVGVLSGMLPGAYSVTINWAPPASFPTFAFGPGFLLRDTLETCDSYAEAVRTLTRTPLSTSVFFTVCGTEKGQACVIERTQRRAAVRPITGPVLVQANHHVAGRFARNNEAIREVEEGAEVVQFTFVGQSVVPLLPDGAALARIHEQVAARGAGLTLAKVEPTSAAVLHCLLCSDPVSRFIIPSPVENRLVVRTSGTGDCVLRYANVGTEHLRDRRSFQGAGIGRMEEGEFLIVPRGVEHRPVADEEAQVLLFEPATTLNTGNVRDERTVADPERI
jgi:hypothetical protein